MRAWYQAADERGFGIVSDSDEQGNPIFLLQCRAVDREFSLPDTQGVPVSLVTRIAISNCPFCGRDLRKWYQKDLEKLRNLDR